MKPIPRLIITILIGGCAAITSVNVLAASKPAAAEFYPLLGHWRGQGELDEAGQKPVKLSLKLKCEKVSSGWAVSCAMQAKNKQLIMMESDLMGVDPLTGQAHWYAVTNQGETHDHLANWRDANTMDAHYEWLQDGKLMREDITFQLQGKHSMNFKSVTTSNGVQVGEFTGKLKR